MYTTGLRPSLSKVRKQILSRESSAAPGVDAQLHAGTCWPDVLSQHPACGVRKACPCLSAPRPQPPLPTPPPWARAHRVQGPLGAKARARASSLLPWVPEPAQPMLGGRRVPSPGVALSWCHSVELRGRPPGRGVGVRMSPVQTEKGNGKANRIRAGGLVGAGKRNGKENKTLRPDPKGQLSVGQGQSLCLLGQWEPGRGLEQEVGARCREMK